LGIFFLAKIHKELAEFSPEWLKVVVAEAPDFPVGARFRFKAIATESISWSDNRDGRGSEEVFMGKVAEVD
jgi:hypothetical protein